jgi:hypothetical protein
MDYHDPMKRNCPPSIYRRRKLEIVHEITTASVAHHLDVEDFSPVLTSVIAGQHLDRTWRESVRFLVGLGYDINYSCEGLTPPLEIAIAEIVQRSRNRPTAPFPCFSGVGSTKVVCERLYCRVRSESSGEFLPWHRVAGMSRPYREDICSTTGLC